MATSIDYPVGLPCPTREGNSMIGGETFDRSQFDFGVRQRESYYGSYLLDFAFVCKTPALMKSFKDFYYTTLAGGSLSFNADWEVEGASSSKEFRFVARYTAKSMSGGLYSVQGKFEMLTKIEDI